MEQSDHIRATVAPEFPIFGGGPLYHLLEQLRLVREGRRRQGLVALYAVLIAWLPLVILTAAEGMALGRTHFGSFLIDFEANVRFLLAVPALVLGERMCVEQLRTVLWQFHNADLLREETPAQFQALIEDTVRLSHSNRAEAVIIGLAYLHSAVAFLYVLNFPEQTWRLPVRDGRHVLSLSGGWYFLVSFPLFSLLLLRWVMRIGLWWRLLWQISRLKLSLSPAHRDGAGGLGFLSESLSAFTGFAIGVTAATAGSLADFIVYQGDAPLQFKWEVIGLMVVLLLAVAGPLMFFVRRLYEAKEEAVFQYGALASRQTQQVEGKWLSAESLHQDLGIDFRSLAHLGSSVTAVRQMSVLPLYKDDVLKFLFLAFLPFVPLLATLVPMDEVFSLLLKVLV